MIIECMPGKIAVVLDPPDEKVGGGLIYKPDTVKGDNHIGTVIAVSEDVTTIAVDHRVIVPRYAGSPVTIDGREIIFLKSTDVLARLTCELAHVSHD